MSHHSFSQPASPYFLTYTYTSRHVSEQQDNRSVASNCTFTSRSSNPQSFTSTHRINQLTPKSKIILSKCSTLAHSKKQHDLSTLLASQPLPPAFDPPLTRRTQSVITESIEYRNIRPSFNWGKLNLFCGFQRVKLGQDGCICGEPCPWREGWIKTRERREAGVLMKVMREKPEEENRLQIEKDLDRTYPECPTFSQNKQFRTMLKNVLVWYSIYDRKTGYVQGMNMIAGVLLYHIKSAELAFWALVEMMFEKQLRTMYLNDFLQLSQHCQNIVQMITLRINDLYDHMIQLEIMPASFLNGWLLSMMSNAIPMEHMHRVIEGFRREGWDFMYRLVLTYLIFLKDRLIMCEDQSEFLLTVSVQSGHDMGAEWEEVIESCEKLVL